MTKNFFKWHASGLTMALAAAAICFAGSNATANDVLAGQGKSRHAAASPILLAQAQPGGSIITLDAPRIADYWMSATLQPGGVIVFDGYAPDDATRRALQQFQGADTSWLKLGSGAPGA